MDIIYNDKIIKDQGRMYFTDYIVTESSGNSLDPLGFLRPSGEITDAIFRQFTVLSNHPAYHGFLCFVFEYLEAKGIKPGSPGFSRKFRDIEILWGLLNKHKGDSILNITKYSRLVDDGVSKLSETHRYASIFARLNYGTLGHYSSPSIFWKILDSKGIHLTDLGRELGAGWRLRNGANFADLVTPWLAGKDVVNSKEFTHATEYFRIGAKPSEGEKKAWRKLIRSECDRNHVIAPIWEKPIPKQILGAREKSDKYIQFFSGILNHYKSHPDLTHRISQCRRFEALSSLIQFVFEWEYVRRLPDVKLVGLEDSHIEKLVTSEIISLVDEFMTASNTIGSWIWLGKLAGLRSYRDLAAAIIKHHSDHQKSKGTSPFVSGDDVVVRDRVDSKEFAKFLDEIKEQDGNIPFKIQTRHMRDWHFHRASTWLEYAGGIQ